MRKIVSLSLLLVAQIAGAQLIPTFTTSPLVTIDSAGTDTSRASNRLTDARRLSDGRIIAALCGKSELRSYDASGKYLGRLPLAEDMAPQRFLFRMFPAGGDSLVAYEALNARLSLVGPDLKVVRTINIPNPDTSALGQRRSNQLNVLGRLSDGSFIGRWNAQPTPGAGLHRQTMHLYRFTETGGLTQSVTLPAGESVTIPGQPTSRAPRLGRATTVAVMADRIIVGDQASPFLVEHGLDFKPTSRIPTMTHPTFITDSMKAAWTQMAMNRANFPMNGVTSVYTDVYPDSTPAFGDLVAGTDGRIWAQDPMGADYYPLIWTAYQNGRAVARVEVPPRFYPTQFGPDWVLGLAYEEVPVDRVQLLKLTPGVLTNPRLTPRQAAPANRPRCGAWTSR
jgi:hypothetical protein